MTLLTSNEIKSVLKITDCELMHRRSANELAFEKRGNAFFYSLPSTHSLLQHPLGQQLLNWHYEKHNFDIDNNPIEKSSIDALERLVADILLPIERKFARPVITYGFTSAELKKLVNHHSPAGTAPSIDQHSAHEKNQVGNLICERGGAACDFYVDGVSNNDITRYVTAHLNFDRIYFYGNNKPLHVSVTLTSPAKHLQVMGESKAGRRYPARKAFGESALALAESL